MDGGVVESYEGAIIGYEEESIQSTIAEEGCCGACTSMLSTTSNSPSDASKEWQWNSAPLTNVPAWSKCCLNPTEAVVAP